MTDIWPTEIKGDRKTKTVDIVFEDGVHGVLDVQALREKSTPAPTKTDVNILDITPAGKDGVQFVFDDEHTTPIYSWSFLYELAKKYEETLISHEPTQESDPSVQETPETHHI